MCARKKKDFLFHVDGFEAWMDQFLADPYASFHYPHGIRVDLFETETEYIIEAEMTGFAETDISVRRTESGLCIQAVKLPDSTIERDIALPIDVRTRHMSASLDGNLLSIHISKHNPAPAPEQTIRFTD